MICHNDSYFARFLGKYSSGSWIHCFHLFAYEFMMEIPIPLQNTEQPYDIYWGRRSQEREKHFVKIGAFCIAEGLASTRRLKRILHFKMVISHCEMMHSCGPSAHTKNSHARGEQNRGCRRTGNAAGRGREGNRSTCRDWKESEKSTHFRERYCLVNKIWIEQW